ncbi:MAG: polysaccharide deacetylase family protein [Phycisphaerales bacterium]
MRASSRRAVLFFWACSASPSPAAWTRSTPRPTGPTSKAASRGDPTSKEIALIFTAATAARARPLSRHACEEKVKASFFVTGDYVAQPGYDAYLKRIVNAGHYLGPHSHAHLLYASWDNRDESLVTEQQFKEDLQQNIDELRAFGAMPRGKPVYFIPPYEWYNAKHAEWADEMGCVLFNYTPGTGSHRDWKPEGHAPSARPPRSSPTSRMRGRQPPRPQWPTCCSCT